MTLKLSLDRYKLLMQRVAPASAYLVGTPCVGLGVSSLSSQLGDCRASAPMSGAATEQCKCLDFY
eukprot:3743009-Amphidinium_carterae.1